MTDKLLDGFRVGHQGAPLQLIPEPVSVADAVGAAQRAALGVVQAESALAVLNDFAGTIRQLVELLPTDQRSESVHLVSRNGLLFTRQSRSATP